MMSTNTSGTKSDVEKMKYSLEYMEMELKNNTDLDVRFIELLSLLIDKDIYVLDMKTQTVLTSYHKDRNSVVILMMEGEGYIHFETVGIMSPDGIIDTHFHPLSNFIEALRDALQL